MSKCKCKVCNNLVDEDDWLVCQECRDKAKNFENAIDRTDAPEIIRDYFVEYFRHLASGNNGKITASTDGRVTVE